MFSAIMDALKTSSGAVDEQQKQAIMMQNAMLMLSGNWAPLDKCHAAIREYLVADLNNDLSAESRTAYAAMLSEKANSALAESTMINTELAMAVKEDVDPFGHTATEVKKLTAAFCDAILDHKTSSADGELKFSDKMRVATVEFAGEWLQGLTTMMNDGYAGTTAFLQKLSFFASQQVMAKYPQHAQMAMLGIPMALNLLKKFHREYCELHSIDVPAASPLTGQ